VLVAVAVFVSVSVAVIGISSVAVGNNTAVLLGCMVWVAVGAGGRF
jgi:hypothetical protein